MGGAGAAELVRRAASVAESEGESGAENGRRRAEGPERTPEQSGLFPLKQTPSQPLSLLSPWQTPQSSTTAGATEAWVLCL